MFSVKPTARALKHLVSGNYTSTGKNKSCYNPAEIKVTVKNIIGNNFEYSH